MRVKTLSKKEIQKSEKFEGSEGTGKGRVLVAFLSFFFFFVFFKLATH